ncbi:hypothetical protein [Demequina zhanjiangensis]|uniref:Uncharacterized protein n=1 Tax=Demequina zhanjiangensis TaxID=3051659 RepID=A0ABT8G058_9MICO|nr:hypothetical protein [Demequina sp. SYSU T00b26]MDN4472530.1 hypothetical protein [Demequina sp. SYSU T00b26]
MDFYAVIAYPAVLIVSGALVVVGLAVLISGRGHRLLKAVVTAAWIATAVHLITVVVALLSGNDAGVVLTLGYLLASVALLPLLGIGRLGEPPAPGETVDPDRPVLRPDQIMRLDAIAAIIIGIAIAVVAWRVAVIMGAA